MEEYLEGLPPDRRAAVSRVRDVVNGHLPAGYREWMSSGMITWGIPLETYRDTYNRQPLVYAALASQKNYMSLYLMAAYASSDVEKELRAGFRRAGKKLDMGKSCLRFRTLDDLPLDVVAKAVASTPPRSFIARYESSRRR